MQSQSMQFGPQILANGGVKFNIWAPSRKEVSLRVDGPENKKVVLPMECGQDGWFSLVCPWAHAGTRYQFGLAQGEGMLFVADPASRFQPDGIFGDSEVIDPESFIWEDGDWKGRSWRQAVIQEVHIGTFTEEGTYEAAQEKVDHVAKVATVVQIMPVAAFPGKFGWGYDGVLPYSSFHHYGRPEQLKALVQKGHKKGLMMAMDVVYNHFGPEGNFLYEYATPFFTSKYGTPWGNAINFEDSPTTRRFYIDNAMYWVEELHFDILRLDATHCCFDASDPHFIEEMAATVHAYAKKSGRCIHLFMENGDLNMKWLIRAEGGEPVVCTAIYADDFHHICRVLGEKGKAHTYFRDYAEEFTGVPTNEMLGIALRDGLAYQGQKSVHDKVNRGSKCDHLPLEAFVVCNHGNHDQIGNSALGDRAAKRFGKPVLNAFATLRYGSPLTPLTFQGDEWDTANPFCYFADMPAHLGVTEGRRHEFAGDPQFAQHPELVPDPCSATTFQLSKLNWSELKQPEHASAFERDARLFRIRMEKVLPLFQDGVKLGASFQTFGKTGLYVSYEVNGGHYVLFANLGDESLEDTDIAKVFTDLKAVEVVSTTHDKATESLAQGRMDAWSVTWMSSTGN